MVAMEPAHGLGEWKPLLPWLYSFDATESGTVVFPDNDDALFIQNDGGFEFRVGYTAIF